MRHSSWLLSQHDGVVHVPISDYIYFVNYFLKATTMWIEQEFFVVLFATMVSNEYAQAMDIETSTFMAQTWTHCTDGQSTTLLSQ